MKRPQPDAAGPRYGARSILDPFLFRAWIALARRR